MIERPKPGQSYRPGKRRMGRRTRRDFSVWAAWALMFALLAPSIGAEDLASLVQPSAALAPIEVVRVQLEALQRNDEPWPDAGIAQTWALAHPQNKAYTGPFQRFSGMIRSPQFRAMLNHRSHVIEKRVEQTERAVYLVLIHDASNRAVGYEWTVEKVRSGDHAGCWMTTGVSPPLPLGEVI